MINYEVTSRQQLTENKLPDELLAFLNNTRIKGAGLDMNDISLNSLSPFDTNTLVGFPPIPVVGLKLYFR